MESMATGSLFKIGLLVLSSVEEELKLNKDNVTLPQNPKENLALENPSLPNHVTLTPVLLPLFPDPMSKKKKKVFL